MPGYWERRGTIHMPSGGGSSWAVAYTLRGKFHLDVPLARDLALDLADPTGRAHAAWWLGNIDFDRVIAARDALGLSRATRRSAMKSCMCPEDGRDHRADADIIRRLVLHVAGREVSA
jgi:hypothetical protein